MTGTPRDEAGVTPVGIAVTALERIAELEDSVNGLRVARAIASEAAAKAIAPQPQPAPGGASEIVDRAVKEWLDRRTATALATAPGIDDREQGKRQGIEQLRYLHLDDYWYVLTPAILAALKPQPAPELAAAREASDLQVAEIIAERNQYRIRLAKLIDELKTTAAATHPSKKSEIEFAIKRKLEAILNGLTS